MAGAISVASRRTSSRVSRGNWHDYHKHFIPQMGHTLFQRMEERTSLGTMFGMFDQH